MILYPPIQFDANECFVIIAAVIVWTIILSLPKRFSKVMIILIWVFNYFLAEMADFTLAVPALDMYDFNDWPQYEYIDLFMYFFLYPPTAYLFLYAYDKWKWKGWRLALFIVASAAISTGLEGIAALFHVFTYKGWRLIYSFPTYIVIYYLNIIVFRFGKKHEKPQKSSA